MSIVRGNISYNAEPARLNLIQASFQQQPLAILYFAHQSNVLSVMHPARGLRTLNAFDFMPIGLLRHVALLDEFSPFRRTGMECGA